jgi:hypothetical protein
MHPVWTPRREDVVRDCLVSPDVFPPMVERLAACGVPYPPGLETEAGQRHVSLYLQGLRSHWPGKNAEDIAPFGEVERPVSQDCIGTVPWEHRPLLTVFVGPVAERLGAPDGMSAVEPRRFPTRGPHSGGGKRPWCGHRGKVDHGQGGVCMG